MLRISLLLGHPEHLPDTTSGKPQVVNMTKKNTAGQQDLSWVHTALESLSGKNGDPKHGSVLFRRASMAHMALGHPDNAFEFAAVEKISHCQRGVPASCGWAELCSLWGWQTLGDGIPCSATCMSRMSDVSNTLMDTTTANHTNPKINKNIVSTMPAASRGMKPFWPM